MNSAPYREAHQGLHQWSDGDRPLNLNHYSLFHKFVFYEEDEQGIIRLWQASSGVAVFQPKQPCCKLERARKRRRGRVTSFLFPVAPQWCPERLWQPLQQHHERLWQPLQRLPGHQHWRRGSTPGAIWLPWLLRLDAHLPQEAGFQGRPCQVLPSREWGGELQRFFIAAF